jgi:hypothetical protein
MSCGNKIKGQTIIPIEDKIVSIADFQNQKLIDDEPPSVSVSIVDQIQYIRRDPSYDGYQYSFEPLADDEILAYSYSYGWGEEKYKYNN